MRFAIFLFLATLLSISHAERPNTIHHLRPLSGAGGRPVEGLDCLSWRLAVETNNRRGWTVVPESCGDYVGHYMLGEQYRRDCEAVVDAAIEFAESFERYGDGKDVWVIDIDETALSNTPYYARSDVQFGAIPYNSTKFNEWVAEARAPPVPAVLRLYNKVVSLGFKIVFLTGSRETTRAARIANLKKVGYTSWEKLILRGEGDGEVQGIVYKSNRRTELVNQGYRIVGNVGDQWSDLLGADAGNRTFKVPDPMYYIA